MSFSIGNNFWLIPDACDLLISNGLGYESMLERDLRNEESLIKNYFSEEGYRLGLEFGNAVSLLGAAGVLTGEIIQLWVVIMGTAVLTNGIISGFNDGSSGEGDSKPVKPESAATGSKKHGVNWKEGPAKAKATGNP